MKAFHLLHIAMLGCLISPTLLPAQTAPTTNPQSREIRRGSWILDQVKQIIPEIDNVSLDQQAKITSVIENARTEMRGMIEELQQADPQTRRQRLQQFRTKLFGDISNVLNPEQVGEFRTKFERIRETIAAATQPSDRMAAAMQRFNAALEKLDLNDDQKTKLQQLRDDTRKRLVDLRTEVQEDSSQAREKYEIAMRDMREQLATILTREQIQQFRNLLAPTDGETPAFTTRNETPAPTTAPRHHMRRRRRRSCRSASKRRIFH